MLECPVKEVVIFGDSILRPIIITPENRYAVSKSIDWAKIENTLDIKIDNRSRMGATIEYGAKVLTEYLTGDALCDIALIEYGGNDSDYDWTAVAGDDTVSHPPKTTPEVFSVILNEMLDAVIAKNIKPVLMTLPPIISQRYFDWFTRSGLDKTNIMKHLGDIETIYRHQEIYSNIIIKTAMQRSIEFVDIRDAFLHRPDFAQLLCVDGIHPNEDGEQVIVDCFLDFYRK
jgi:lysophospholipase L1-like esterase